jgi:hypothetical protein
LETRREYFLFLLALAEAVAEAELTVAVITGFLGSAETQVGGRRFLYRRGCIEGNNGAITETGAFAEGCRCWFGLLVQMFHYMV